MKYIMSLDAGTTSSRCILFDRQGDIVSQAQKEFTQYFPASDRVEHDPIEIWDTQLSVAREAMANIGAAASDIAAIGIADQRETTVVWDKTIGEPVCRAIVWQDRRTAGYCEEISKDMSDTVREKTGLIIDPYFSATKIRWILENIPHARDRAERGDLLFGTIETWLIWKLTGGRIHVTDCSNASRTMLFDIHALTWDKELLSAFGIPETMLPKVVPSSCVYGETEPELFGGCIPIAGAAGDQQAALFGQTCFEKGDVKSTYGTGCFLLMNTGDAPASSSNGLLTTVAWGIGGKVTYALEGSVFVAGSLIQWLRDQMRLLDSAADSEYFARKVKDTNGCYVVPAFTGLGAPYWDPYARGAIVGLSRGVNKCHIIRASLESLAFQTYDVLSAMEADLGSIGSIRADGGASANDLLMQVQADILMREVHRPRCIETTALGAAYLAGLAVGYYDMDSLSGHHDDTVFEPSITYDDQQQRIKKWHKAVAYTRDWEKE